MKALVVGGHGFVGRHLRAHLEACGDTVVAPPGPGDSPDDGLDVTDAEGVQAALDDVRPEAVYHLAALSHIGESWGAPQRVFRVNAEGTLNVLRACTTAGVERVLVVGSADEYGAIEPPFEPITEGRALRPMTPYGASKVAADFLALQAHLGDRLGTIRVRSFNHTGPGQAPTFVVPAIARRIVLAARGGLQSVAVGSLDAVRDYTDVRDVVRAYRTLVERGEPGEVYNVCSGRGRTVGEVVDGLIAVSGTSVEPEIDPELVRPSEVPWLVGDSTKLRTATGWQPEITFEQTLRDTLDDVARRIDEEQPGRST